MNSRETFTDLAIRAALMVAVYVVFAAMLPSYHTVRGAAALLDGGVLIGLTALGIGITMIAGEFDLSVGSLAAVIGVLTVNLIIAGMSIVPAIAIAVAVACAFGALQGFVIAVTGINSLVFTIGTLIGLRGFAMIISKENSVTIPIPRLGETDFFAQRFLESVVADQRPHVRCLLRRSSVPSLHRVGARDLRDRRRSGGGSSRRCLDHPPDGDCLCALWDARRSGGSRFVGSPGQRNATGI